MGGVGQTLAWVVWVCKILSWVKKMAWVAWVHKILSWVKKMAWVAWVEILAWVAWVHKMGMGPNFGIGQKWSEPK